MSKRINWTSSVQILITTAEGAPVTDAKTVRATLAALVGKVTYRRQIEDEGDGLWLVDLPTEIYAKVEDGDELTLNIHATGTVIEIAGA